MRTVAVVLALIIPPAVYFPTAGAQHKKDQQLAEEELARLEQRVQTVRSAQQDMQTFLQDDAHLATDIEQYRVTLPPKLGTSDILRTLEAATTRNGVQLIRFAPRPATQSPPLQVVSIEAEVDGPQAAKDALLQQLGDRPQPGQRFLTVSGVTSSGTRTSFVLTGYALPDGK